MMESDSSCRAILDKITDLQTQIAIEEAKLFKELQMNKNYIDNLSLATSQRDASNLVQDVSLGSK